MKKCPYLDIKFLLSNYIKPDFTKKCPITYIILLLIFMVSILI